MERNFWLKMIAKIVAIMLLPLSMGVDITEYGNSLYYESILVTIGPRIRLLVFEPPPGVYPSLNLNMLLIATALVLCAPGIYFNNWLSQQPRGRSIKKQLFAAMVLVPMMIYPASFLLLGQIIDPEFYLYEYPLTYLPTWVIVVLVLLPVSTREGSFIDEARRSQGIMSTTGNQTATISRFPGKGMLMALVVGLVALLVPFLAQVDNWSDGQISAFFISTSWSGSVGSWSGFSYLRITPTPFASVFMLTFLIAPILFLFNLAFGHSVLLYLQSRTSIVRTALYGILGMAVPFLLYSVPYLMTGQIPEYATQYIPLPVLQVVCVLMVLFVEPAKLDERIWDDTDDRMWFDEGDSDAQRGPERRPKVTIPLTYMLSSRIRSLWNGSSNRTATTDPQKADWAHDEEIWT